MTNFLHWRKMTWALVLWSGYPPAWIAVTGSGLAIVMLWWLGGTILLGSLWLATQPLFQRGRGLGGVFVRPGWTHWRFVDFHRTYGATVPHNDAG